MPDLDHIRDALYHLATLLTEIADNLRASAPEPSGDDPPLCTPVRLPTHLQVRAAQTAVQQNPANAPPSAAPPEDAPPPPDLSGPDLFAKEEMEDTGGA